jgi:hypothetical protein
MEPFFIIFLTRQAGEKLDMFNDALAKGLRQVFHIDLSNYTRLNAQTPAVLNPRAFVVTYAKSTAAEKAV